MPDFPTVDVHERDTIVSNQAVSLSRARDLGIQFLSSILSNNNACEYGGYLTKVARDQIHTLRSATDTSYRPLQDLKSSDPSTVKTAMVEAHLLSSDCGQQFVVVTTDEQIYKVSWHSYSQLVHDLTTVRDELSEHPTHHKEESKARIQADVCESYVKG